MPESRPGQTFHGPRHDRNRPETGAAIPYFGRGALVSSSVGILSAGESVDDPHTERRAVSEPPVTQPLDARIAELRRFDSVHDCRMRLVSIRTRIETNWPSGGGPLRRGPRLDPVRQAAIADLVAGLPCPLPLEAGSEPVPLIKEGQVDLRAATGRAVDAAMALLDRASLETVYPGDVTLFESNRPGAAEPITVSQPTVGLLVATIIATLEAIAELIGPKAQPSTKAASQPSPKSFAKPKDRRDVRRP